MIQAKTRRMNAIEWLPVVVLIAIFGGACQADMLAGFVSGSQENWLIGQWARDRSGCSRPEFLFYPQIVSIQTDADGRPIRFDYPNASYRIGGAEIAVDLSKRHPYGKTPSKTALNFVLRADGRAEMQGVFETPVILIRCDKVAPR